jgi:hypothetical protein
MDPVAIITALSAGTIAGLTDTAKTAISDGYNKLKGLLTKKHGKDSDVVQAIEKLEAKPESKGRKETLVEEIVAVKAEQDKEIIAAANQILIVGEVSAGKSEQYHDSSVTYTQILKEKTDVRDERLQGLSERVSSPSIRSAIPVGDRHCSEY